MLSDYQRLVQKLIRDDAGIVDALDIDAAISMAAQRYSSDKPFTVVEDVMPNGHAELPLPVQWDLNVSSLFSLEYPLGHFPPELIEQDRYGVYQTPSGQVILLDFVPESVVRVTYTVGHVLTNSIDSIPLRDREAVVNWAAALCCEQLASWFANAGDSTIQADRVERLSQSKDYSARANQLRKRYFDAVGVADKKAAPSGVVVNWDLHNSIDQDRFTHPNRFR